MSKLKFYACKVDYSLSTEKKLKGECAEISNLLKESATGVIMEPEIPFLPHFYAIFRTRKERDEFHLKAKGKIGKLKITKCKECFWVEDSQFTKEYLGVNRA